MHFYFLLHTTKGYRCKIHYINPNEAKYRDRATSAFLQKMMFTEAKKGLWW